MKTTVLILGMLLGLAGCKEPDTHLNPIEENPNTNTISLDVFNNILCDIVNENWSPTKKAAFLKKYSKTICALNIYSCVNDAHYDSIGEVERLIAEFPGEKVWDKIDWKKINEDTKGMCYEKYLQFYYDTINKQIEYELVDDFKENSNCYSILLFRYIATKKLKLPDNDTQTPFEFTRAKADGSKIVFKIKGDTYNYSQDPMFTLTAVK